MVLGLLPSSEADQLLTLVPYQPSCNKRPSPLNKSNSEEEFESNLAQAIQASLTGVVLILILSNVVTMLSLSILLLMMSLFFRSRTRINFDK